MAKKWYFTGKTCKHGHISKRLVIGCKCLGCCAVENKNWWQNNSDFAKARQTNYRKSNHAHWIYNMVRNRATKNNIEFNLDRSDIQIPEKCPILGIPLHYRNKRSDDSPSVDRIDPALGYTKGNIVVISWRANRIKSNATIDELEKIYNFYKK